MSEEEAFLGAIRASPADNASRLVYADWLDERGQSDRAAFLRAECAAAAGKPMPPRDCRRYAKALPAEWLRAVGRPGVAGTSWVSQDEHGPARVWFLGDGDLRFQRFAHGTIPESGDDKPKGVPGKWQQVGAVVLFNVNDYSDHFGRLDGARMAVRWTNRAKRRGAWVFRQVQEAEPPAPGPRRKRRKSGGS